MANACDEAVQTLKRSLEPLTNALKDIANSDNGDATAVGSAGILRRYRFVLCIFFMVEVLSILTRLSNFPNRKSFFSTSKKPAVTHAKSTLHNVNITSINNTCTSDRQHELSTYMYMETNALADEDSEEFYETCARPREVS